MNRKERRAIGFTESRYRKMDVDAGNKIEGYNPFYSYSRSDAYKLGDSTMQRTQRLDGYPRRWQYEKARRKLDELTRLTEELGLYDEV